MAYKVPDDLRYTKEHEWAKLMGDLVLVGITDYAQSALGDIVYIELPPVGTQVEQMGAFGTIEAVKAASDLYSPVSGEVVEVNEALVQDPSKVNQDPYGEGWMVKIKPKDLGELDKLLSPEEYKKLLEEIE